MPLAKIVLDQILIMFILILIGYICYRFKVIDQGLNKKLSDLLLLLVSPLLIFNSYQREFSKDLLAGLLISLGLAIFTHLFGILTAYVFLRNKTNSDVVIERFSTIYSNSGFFGIPIINGIYGSEGVFYITAYITIFNLFVWTQGLIMMNGVQDKKTMVKTLVSPTLISIILGFLFFITQIHLPKIMFNSLQYVADMNTPLAMIIAGVTIAQTNILKIFLKFRIYFVVFLKLIFIPVILLLIYSRLPIAIPVLAAAVLGAACPTGATGTLFAIRYEKNALYSSEIFAMTTLISLITIPIIMGLMDYLR
ncbi:AEC family transporter [Anaerocolumna sp. MB42-C2]|uniref:AEC family transporter n=1 Tax=Anaerocolumna sp. MB42-C2 TaxID=3070997 RepID=UPI0027E0BE3F|nr:AEC family transporter [Anaerocolumna sp. MB42-C2]WMJ86108.1 AEC family transporter [Anaerocolumna sp. MB42-C2]